MSFIQWSNELSVSVAVIDEQHKKLISIVNDIHDTVVAGAERTALNKIFDELISYTVYHFKTEEGFFERTGYGEKDAHRAQHNELTQKALELQASFEQGSATVSYEVLDFLHDWLMTHILGSDRKFGAFLAARGLAASLGQ